MRDLGIRIVALLLCGAAAWAQDEPEHVRLREQERARAAKLAEEVEALRTEAGELEADLKESTEELRAAKQKLDEWERAYAGEEGAPRPPGKFEVPEELRRLGKAADRAAYHRELDAIDRLAGEYRARLDRAGLALATFPGRLEKARLATPEDEWPAEERQWNEIQARTRMHVRDQQQLLEQMLETLSLQRGRRQELQRVYRDTLFLLQHQNLLTRSHSELNWDAVTSGARDLGALPAWLAGAVAEVGRYVAAPDRRAVMLELGGLALLLVLVLLFLRRYRTKQVRRLAETEEVQARARAAYLTAHLLLVSGAAAVILLLTQLAASLGGLSAGVAAYLRHLGYVLAACWLAWRVMRAILRPRIAEAAILKIDPEVGRPLWLGTRVLILLSLVFLPILFALEDLGYENRGAIEACWLLHKILFGIVLIVLLARGRLLAQLVREREGRGVRVYRWTVRWVRPVALVLIPAIVILGALRYDILAGLITKVSVALLASTIAGALLYRVFWNLLEARLASRYPADAAEEQANKREATRQGGRFLLFLLCLLLAVWIFQALSDYNLDALRGLLDVPLPFQSSEVGAVTWWNIVAALVLLVLFMAAIRPAKLVLKEHVLARTSLDEGIQYTITTLSGYVLVTIAVLMASREIFDLSSLGYIAAALSVGIGFGLQEIVSNFISGLILLFERPLKVGDFVEVGGTEGIVRQINIRATTVQTRDNIVLLVPNKDFITQAVVNYVHRDPKIRIRVAFGVSYRSDVELVRRVVLEVAAGNERVLRFPAPDVWFRAFGESSLDFELLVWISHPKLQHAIRSDLYFEIFKALAENGIEIPFPQRDLHVRSADALREIFGPGGKPAEPPPGPAPADQ